MVPRPACIAFLCISCATRMSIAPRPVGIRNPPRPLNVWTRLRTELRPTCGVAANLFSAPEDDKALNWSGSSTTNNLPAGNVPASNDLPRSTRLQKLPSPSQSALSSVGDGLGVLDTTISAPRTHSSSEAYASAAYPNLALASLANWRAVSSERL